MKEALKPSPKPELVFGLVAPIGVDLDLMTEVLSQTLREMNYDSHEFRLTSLMKEIPTGKSIKDSPYIKSYQDRIAYANEVRGRLGDEALAALAISAIRSFRAEEWERRNLELATVPGENIEGPSAREQGSAHTLTPSPASLPASKRLEEVPLPGQAYIVQQFKRQEEIALLRSVYGRQFIQVSAYSPQEIRRRRIEERERQSRSGLVSDVDAHKMAYELVVQDAKETLDQHGQNVRDAFPLGDVFIDATSRSTCEATLRRFILLLFGNNEIAPTHDEYGMYMAKSASLRSSDLSRQVGAAVFRPSGEVVALGCNEVPKAGGGTYWSGDPAD
jgi:cytidine deaminase